MKLNELDEHRKQRDELHQHFHEKLVCVQFRGSWLYVTGDAKAIPEPMQLKVETEQGPQVVPMQVPFLIGKLVAESRDAITLRYKDERTQPHCNMLVKVSKDMIFTVTVVESVEEPSRIVVPT